MPIAKKLPSGSWRCQVFSHYEETIQPDGTIKKKRIYKSFTSDDPSKKGKKEAELMAAQYSMQKKEVKECSIAVSDAINRYILSKESVLSPSTIKSYKVMQKNNFMELNPRIISDLTTEMIQTWVNSLSKTLSPKSVRNTYTLFSSSVAMFLPSAHFQVVLPQKKRPELYIPTDEDIKRLLEHVKGRDLELAIYLAAFGPMRRGEICALTSDDVKGNVVSVNKSMVLTSDNEWVVKQPKTYASYRNIVYPDFVGEMLAKRKGKIFDFSPNALSDRFKQAIKTTKLPHFRFHDLRHYSASVMHAMGIPDVYIMQRGGWTTDNVMKTVYRHTLNDKEKEMNQKANDYFGNFMQHEMQHKKIKP